VEGTRKRVKTWLGPRTLGKQNFTCHVHSMRPLTEDESKAVFTKIANYIVSASSFLLIYLVLMYGREKISST